MRSLLAILLVVSMLGAQLYTHREVPKEPLYKYTDRIRILCIEPEYSLTVRNNMNSTSRRSGSYGQVLTQWGICDEV